MGSITGWEMIPASPADSLPQAVLSLSDEQKRLLSHLTGPADHYYRGLPKGAEHVAANCMIITSERRRLMFWRSDEVIGQAIRVDSSAEAPYLVISCRTGKLLCSGARRYSRAFVNCLPIEQYAASHQLSLQKLEVMIGDLRRFLAAV